MRSIGLGRRNACRPIDLVNPLQEVERGSLDRRACKIDVTNKRCGVHLAPLEECGCPLDPETRGLDGDRRLAYPRGLMRIAASASAQEMLAQRHKQGFHPSGLNCGEAPRAARKIRLAVIIPGLAKHVLGIDPEPREFNRPAQRSAHALCEPTREIELFVPEEAAAGSFEPGWPHPWL